jgi:hypothetical protein
MRLPGSLNPSPRSSTKGQIQSENVCLEEHADLTIHFASKRRSLQLTGGSNFPDAIGTGAPVRIWAPLHSLYLRKGQHETHNSSISISSRFELCLRLRSRRWRRELSRRISRWFGRLRQLGRCFRRCDGNRFDIGHNGHARHHGNEWWRRSEQPAGRWQHARYLHGRT